MCDRAIEAIKMLERQIAFAGELRCELAQRTPRTRQQHLKCAAFGLLEKAAIAALEVLLTRRGQARAVDDQTRRARADGEHPCTREEAVDHAHDRRAHEEHR